MSLYIFLCLFVCLCVSVRSQQEIQVKVAQGVIQGQRAIDGDYFTFFGIHYAGHVEGENRFKAASPAPMLPGVFIASDPNVICAQPSPQGIIGTENCLVLNIYTKDLTVKKPVMVWLMGEDYSSGNYQELKFKRLVETQDVVVVTLNYRLSIFGFLCLRVKEAPGNAGLKDVIAGLHWIQENIGGFGGDQNNVMLAGHGSAAAMVDLVTLSPLSNGLIHRAIAQSGSSLAPWAVAYRPEEYARAVGNALGYTGQSKTDLAISLQNTSLALLGPILNLFPFTNNTVLFAPCLENKELNEHPFMVESPSSILASGQYLHIPMIYGYTNREGSLRAPQAVTQRWLQGMQANFEDFLQIDLDLTKDNNKSAIATSIRNFYFEGKNINIETIEDYLDYHGDIITVVSTLRTAAARLRTTTAQVRVYEFGYIGTVSTEWPYPTVPLDGARHGQELVYLFETGSAQQMSNPIDMMVRDSLISRWGRFAKDGNPTTTGPPGNVEWPVITTQAFRVLSYIQVVTDSSLQEAARLNPHEEILTFWNNLYDRYYIAPSPGSATMIVGRTIAVLIVSLIVKMF